MVPPPKPFSEEAKNRPVGETAIAGSAAPFEQSVEPGHTVPGGFGGVAETVKSEKPAAGEGLAAEAPPTVGSTARTTRSAASSVLIESAFLWMEDWASRAYPRGPISKLELALVGLEAVDQQLPVPLVHRVRPAAAAFELRVDGEGVGALLLDPLDVKDVRKAARS